MQKNLCVATLKYLSLRRENLAACTYGRFLCLRKETRSHTNGRKCGCLTCYQLVLRSSTTVLVAVVLPSSAYSCLLYSSTSSSTEVVHCTVLVLATTVVVRSYCLVLQVVASTVLQQEYCVLLLAARWCSTVLRTTTHSQVRSRGRQQLLLQQLAQYYLQQ